MSKTPEIKIKYSWLLHQKVSPVFWEKFWSDSGKVPAQKEELIAKAEAYRESWKSVEKTVLDAISTAFDLDFNRDVIDVHLAPYIPAMSSPLIINFRYEPDNFIDILSHELIHIIISENSQKFNFLNWANENYPNTNVLTRNHILVHAGLKYVYLDALGDPERLARDIASCQQWPGYKEAWDIVERDGYKQIIDKAKQYYGPK